MNPSVDRALVPTICTNDGYGNSCSPPNVHGDIQYVPHHWSSSMKVWPTCATVLLLFVSHLTFAQVSGSGTPPCVPLWSTTTNLGSSILCVTPSSIASSAFALSITSSNTSPGLGPVLTLTNKGSGALQPAAAIDFNSYAPNLTTSSYNPGARILAVDDNWSSDIVFQSNVTGGPNGGLQTNMIIQANGRVGIGTKFSPPSVVPAATLDVYGQVIARDRLTLMGNRTIISGFDGVNNHWFGPTPDSDLAFGINRIGANNYNFTVNGTTTTKVLTISGGSDLAEPFKMSTTNIPQGAVVVIDEERPGQLKLSDRPYDTRVAGAISGANGLRPGITMHQEDVSEEAQDVALSGRVYVLVDATYGPIQPGDLVTTSSTPGHAMKVTDFDRARGAILGKAMTGLREGRGTVLVLVTLQ